MVREKDIEDYSVQSTKGMGGLAIKLTSSGLRGLPDRMHFYFPAILVFVEYKSPGRKPRPNQIRWHKTLKLLGFTVVTISSMSGVDALHKWVKGKKDKLSRPCGRPCAKADKCIHYEEL